MTYLADAHRDWHVVHGPVVCPLDCGIGEPPYDPYEEINFGGNIICGNCRDLHPTAADVRLCYEIGA